MPIVKLTEAQKVYHAKLLAGLTPVGQLSASPGPPVITTSSGLVLYNDEGLRSLPAALPLIDGFIDQQTLAVLFGPPGSGKSFLALLISFCVGAGLRFHDRAITPAAVAYLTVEGRIGLGRRASALRNAYGAVGPIPVRYILQSVPLLETGEAAKLVADLRSLSPPPGLVVLDTLAQVMSGYDENSGQVMGMMISATARLRDLPAAVLVLHHTLKKNPKEERGSSQLRGAADMMVLARISGSTVTLKHEKTRDNPEFEDMRFELVDFQGSKVAIASNSAGDTATQKSAGLAGRERDVLAILAATEHGAVGSNVWRDLCKAAGIPQSTFYNVVPKLLEQGFVDQAESGSHVSYAITQGGRIALLSNSNEAPA